MPSDMTPPPMQRDNPLTRAYDAIRAQNAGGRPGGNPGLQNRGTVLPPSPVPPPTAEELAEAKRIDEELWGAAEIPQEPASVQFSPEAPPPAAPRSPVAPMTGFIAIDLVNAQVIADNYETFPLTEQEVKQLLASCINIAQRTMTERLLSIGKAIGLEIVSRDPDANMPQVPRGQAEGEVQARPKRRGRPPKNMPVV